MKTFLVWGIETELSESLCLKLARHDRRLLVVGDNAPQLELLDAGLAQSELHRYSVGRETLDLADWTKSQRIGLDGLVVFAKAPASGPSALLAPDALQALVSASLLEPVGVIRSLLPQLERGKKPKSILVVLDWQQVDSNAVSAWVTILKQAWRSCVRQLALELAGSGLVINALDPGNLCSDREAIEADAADADKPPSIARPQSGLAGILDGSLRVQDAASAAARWLDDAVPTQSGQLLELGIPA